MSDTAFKTAAYPGYTTNELQVAYLEVSNLIGMGATAEKIQAELDRRYAGSIGDISAMTKAERLRYERTHSVK